MRTNNHYKQLCERTNKLYINDENLTASTAKTNLSLKKTDLFQTHIKKISAFY